ncbi:zinc transport system ATP-binding protein [Dethiosulfatibacter aminovorans DSM 17477]|uniref:Zinc transport system ATP-binding protein n=1 Tax=Dethiosulfatibacter aminovorans DSM 17477 TaxID=1121476 RepID=A0A1M6C9F8_9FIRM|nr:metal ABC transporter ATP-binding protein [Dethiosulfatibacter aminovorans]SHI57635.1 zinc transport system ATP-binding protein [Dethiosulfatibacter aminovorans DSM 17477]
MYDYDIEVKNVDVYYGDVCALEKASLKIRNKSFLGIIGPNGGGKSTLLKVILHLKKPRSGEVKIKEGLTLGYVPQFALFDRSFPISVEDVVLMGKLDHKLAPFRKYNPGDIKKAEEILARIGIEDLRKRQIGELSGGQLQKVLIARALVTDPDVLLLDEPSSSLDAATKDEMFEFLKELNKEKTIIVVTHDMEIIFNYIDSIACVNKSIHYHDEDKAIRVENIEDVFGCPINVLLQTGTLNKRVIDGRYGND